MDVTKYGKEVTMKSGTVRPLVKNFQFRVITEKNFPRNRKQHPKKAGLK